MSERSIGFGGAIAFALLVLVTLANGPERIQMDIDARATHLLSSGGHHWGQVIASGRDLSLYGTAPDDVVAAQVLRSLRRLWGVRLVQDHTEVAALRAPAVVVARTVPGAASPPPEYTDRERAALGQRISAETCQMLMDGLLSSHSVRFDDDSAVLRAESMPLLEHLATAAVHCPDAVLSVAGHTDDSGDGEHNRRLSTERARAVAEYLASRGVRADRLGIIGHGADRPVADDATPEGRALNRRIEITVEY